MTVHASRPRSALAIVFPWLVIFGCFVYLFMPSRQPAHDERFDVDGFAKLPVSYRGRVKPIDSVARNTLLVLSGRQTLEHANKTIAATSWLLDVLTRPTKAADYKVFRIDHPDVLTMFGLQHSPRKRFAFSELRAHLKDLFERATAIDAVPSQRRDAYQIKVMELASQVSVFDKLRHYRNLHMLPPAKEGQDWTTMPDARHAQHSGALPSPGFEVVSDMLLAFKDGKPQAFNAALSNYQALLTLRQPTAVQKASLETSFNRYAPFYRGLTLYVAAAVLVFLSWLGWSGPLRRAAFFVVVITIVLHTLGLTTRVYLSGRPPVTNLYSSAVFIGWGVVIMCIVLERLYRNSIPTLLAAVMGFLTLIIAHHLASGGDTMAVLVAVLDTNFWLATHVVVITIGYSATYLAGLIGIVYIVRGLLTNTLTKQENRRMGQMLYGVLCFALLFSFVGTILGGIWADQSWGRFWGWDPKENGAVLIVLWNALVLHARWGGMAQQRGLAVLAVFGNIVTSWSWFGTNMLGVGLHSYGFIDTAVFWLLVFIASQLLFISLGSIPLRYWRSFSAPAVRA